MFELTGTRQISSAILNWKIITSRKSDYFEIEQASITALILLLPPYINLYIKRIATLNYTDNIMEL
jgi:hypothetical protein